MVDGANARSEGSQSWTVRRVIAWMTEDFGARGIPSARLDAELLVAKSLEIDRVGLYMNLDRPLDSEELSEIRALVARRRKFEPIAYILGKREFWGLDFEVSPAVLIPRPDTETLVERALGLLPAGDPARVLDVCTGSGAIVVALASERFEDTFVATDLSADALAVARRNAERQGVAERITFLQGDLFGPLGSSDAGFDLICINPPYVARRDESMLQRDVVEFEPHMALFGGDDGLDVIRNIVSEAASWLAPQGSLLMEIGAGQAAAVASIVGACASLEVRSIHADLGRIERVVEIGLRPR